MIVQPNEDLDNGRRDKMLDLMQEATVTTTLLYSTLGLHLSKFGLLGSF